MVLVDCMVTTKKADWTKVSREKFQIEYFSRFSDFFPNIRDLKISLMGFGVATQSGWYNIIWDLTEKIEKELKKNPVKDFEIVQIKEKFGGLRFYVSCASEKIFKMIHKAEDLSFKTCEVCGAPGTTDISHPWYLTLCPKCKEKRDKEFEIKRGA